MNYNISVEDIKEYLSTVPEGEPVGEPNHMDYCLVAKTLQHKYPEVRSYVNGFNAGATVDNEFVAFPDAVFQIAEEFDDLLEPVTTAILREHMPALFEKGEQDHE